VRLCSHGFYESTLEFHNVFPAFIVCRILAKWKLFSPSCPLLTCFQPNQNRSFQVTDWNLPYISVWYLKQQSRQNYQLIPAANLNTRHGFSVFCRRHPHVRSQVCQLRWRRWTQHSYDVVSGGLSSVVPYLVSYISVTICRGFHLLLPFTSMQIQCKLMK